MPEPADVVPLHTAGAPASLGERSDDELMLLARGGRRQAFDALVGRHQRRVLTLAGKQLGDPGLARDVAQEVFLELYRYLPRYQPQGRFRSFLFRVTLNQCRMAGRAAGAERRRREALVEAAPHATVELSVEALLARERRHDVERALAQLLDKLRDVVVLRYAGDLSLQEVADALELPLGTVKSRLFAGVEKLRQVMEVAQ